LADNVELDAGSGGATIATDDDGTAHHQYVKVEFGADDTQTPVDASNPLPTTDADVTTAAEAIQAAVEGTLTVAGTVDLGATDNAVLDSIVSLLTTIDVDTGAAATDLAALEVLITTIDAVLDTIKVDTEAIETATEACQAALETAGGLVVNLGANNDVTVTGTVDLGATDNAVLDDIASDTEAMKTSLAVIDNVVFGAGTEAAAQRVTIATDSTGVLSVDDNGASLTVDNAQLSVVGSGTEATALRVTIATDSTGVLSVDDNAGSLTVDNAALTELAAAINSNEIDVNIATDSVGIGGGIQQTTDEASDGTDVGMLAIAIRNDAGGALYAGTDGDFAPLQTDADGNVRVNVAAGGTSGVQHDEDDAFQDGDTGTLALVVRQDTPAGQSATDGDYDVLGVDANGRLWTNTIGTVDLGATDNAVLDAIAASVAAIDTDATTIIGHVDGIEGLLTTIDADTGGILADTDAIETATEAIQAAVEGTLTVAGTVDLGATDNAVLDAIAASLATLDNVVSGNEAQVDILTIAAGDNNIGNVDIVSGTITTVSTLTGGGVAHDSGDSGNPVKVGGRAVSANVTAMTANDRTDQLTDLLGYQLVRPYALNQNTWSDTAGPITGTTATEVRAAPGANIRLHVTSLLVTNSDATVGTNVIITDGSGGTTLWEGYAAPAGGGFSCTFPTPLRLTANTALFADCETTSSEVRVSAAGFTEIS
jgi:hypothetical protein